MMFAAILCLGTSALLVDIALDRDGVDQHGAWSLSYFFGVMSLLIVLRTIRRVM